MDRPNVRDPGRLIAHRGASQVAPENTLSAFLTAKRQGAHWVEFDVSLLGDGTPVIHHDATLDRCTTRSGPISAIAAKDLGTLEAGPDEPMPTLDQTLDLLEETGMFANLEMKLHDQPAGKHAPVVAQALQGRAWAHDRIIVSSFSVAELLALRALMPDLPLAVVHREPPPNWPDDVNRLHAAALHLRRDHLSHDVIRTARGLGIDLRVFTVNDPTLLAPYRDEGLSGVITDHPPLFLDAPDWADWLNG